MSVKNELNKLILVGSKLDLANDFLLVLVCEDLGSNLELSLILPVLSGILLCQVRVLNAAIAHAPPLPSVWRQSSV